jgi:hypothetical protein
MADKLFISDNRMLQLMRYVFSVKLKGVSTQKEFCDIIGMNKTSIKDVKSGIRGFTREQMYNAGKHFGVDMNWIFGFTNEMFPEESLKIKKPLELLKYAVSRIESEIAPKPNTVKDLQINKDVSKKVSTLK